MGFFDRFSDRLEQDNVEAVYAAELEKMEARIVEHRERVASIRAEKARRERKGDGSDEGFAELVTEAEAVLVQLEKAKRQLEHERLTAPARHAVAQSRVDVADEESRLGASGTAQGLAAVRDTIEAQNRKANPGLLDENGISIRGRQARFSRQAAEDSARAQLEALKAARRPTSSGPDDSDDPPNGD